jgi:hypothetical protein
VEGSEHPRRSELPLFQPGQRFDGDVAEFEVGWAAAMHEAESDCPAVVVNLDDLIGGLGVFAFDEVATLGRACREIQLGKWLGLLAFWSHASRLAAWA